MEIYYMQPIVTSPTAPDDAAQSELMNRRAGRIVSLAKFLNTKKRHNGR